MIQINCNVSGTSDPIVLQLEDGHSFTGVYENSNRIIFKLADAEKNLDGEFVCNGVQIFAPYITPIAPGAYEGPSLVVKPLVQELHIVEDLFVLPDGAFYNWKGSIDWMLYKRSLDGQSIESLLKQRHDAGSRAVATLMQAEFIEHFNPAEYGQAYFDHIIPFAQAILNAGMYWMPVVYADEQVIKSGHDFVYKLGEIFHDYYWIVPSLGNEYNKNGFEPGNFTRPNTNNLWSRGSQVGDTQPYYPSWDWKEWHGRRDWPKVLFSNDDAWYVKEGINGEGVQLDKRAPCIVTEPIGFWNQNVPNRRSNDPNLARVIGGTSVYFARGANFMSEAGLRCDMWDSITYDCAVQFFKAINQ
jgi:hypothetical protein